MFTLFTFMAVRRCSSPGDKTSKSNENPRGHEYGSSPWNTGFLHSEGKKSDSISRDKSDHPMVHSNADGTGGQENERGNDINVGAAEQQRRTDEDEGERYGRGFGVYSWRNMRPQHIMSAITLKGFVNPEVKKKKKKVKWCPCKEI